MALAVLVAWQLFMGATVVVAAVVIVRRRKAGVGFAAAALLGGVLCYGFVSAAASLGEGVWSVSSAGFLIALAIGVVGLGAVVVGTFGLRSNQTS